MTHSSPSASLYSSRLIRILSELVVSDAEVSTHQFGERLGGLIDFSDSIILSAAHGELKGVVFDKSTDSERVAKEEFLNVRGALVDNIVKSTSPNSASPEQTRIRLPRIDLELTIQELTEYEPYHRFYASHQRNIDVKTRDLRNFMRDEVAGYSPKLAQLSRLDMALEDTLTGHSRKYFAAIPRLLEKRFQYLLIEHQKALQETKQQEDPTTWSMPDAWVGQFCKDMQGLLLAELEVRLQPILGLLEALNDEVNKNQ